MTKKPLRCILHSGFFIFRPNIFKNPFGKTTYVEHYRKKRYFEPAPQGIDVENFKKVIQSRRSVRKFTEESNSN